MLEFYHSVEVKNIYHFHYLFVLFILFLYLYFPFFFLSIFFCFFWFFLCYSIHYFFNTKKAILSSRFSSHYVDTHLDEFISRVPIVFLDEECVICKEGFEFNKYRIKCVCRQGNYHMSCIRQWFSHQSTCPVCRTDISFRSQFI